MNPKNEKWSHIAKEYVVSLFPNIMLAEAFINGVNKSAEKNLKFWAQRYEDNSCQYLAKKSDWAKVSGPFAKKVLGSPEFLGVIMKKMQENLKTSLAFAAKVNRMNLKNSANADLLKLYNEFNRLNKDVYDYGLALVLLDFQETTYISDALSKYLKGKVEAEKYSDYFSILTTTPKRTAAREEEISLLKIISKIKNKQKLLNAFLNKSADELAENFLKLDKNIHKEILLHAKKYAWTTYVYEGPGQTYNDFILTVKEFLSRNINPELKLKEIFESEKNLKTKQAEYLKALKPDKYNKNLIKLSRDVAFVKFWRREQQSRSYYLIEPLLKEMARRLNLSVKQIRFLLPEELNGALKGKEIDLEKINRRIKLCILSCENGRGVKLLEGKNAEKFLKTVEKEKIDYNLKELKGQTACPGYAKGKAVIVNVPDDMKKMGDGNILVSFSTNPNLMPAIRKASAIITDEGGLTCHAAIVSRELNIPCVVGLKVVSKIIKDGETVVVDANKGVIKKLK